MKMITLFYDVVPCNLVDREAYFIKLSVYIESLNE
jgi:hypothetical protein